MKLFCRWLVVPRWLQVCSILCLSLEALSAAPAKIQLTVDRSDALYRCDESATFTATVMLDGKPVDAGEVSLRVATWLDVPLLKKKVPLKDGVASLSISSPTPRMILCHAVYLDPQTETTVKAEVGAAFDPQKIKAATEMPTDFDAFWAAGRKRAEAIPFDLKLTRCETSTSVADVFKVSVANINETRAYGYLIVPLQQKAPFPLRVHIHGAGPKPKKVPAPSSWNKKGVMTLELGVHPYDIEPLDGSSKSLKEGYPGGWYSLHGSPDREAYYFYRAILGLNRLVDYVASRHDIDLKHIMMTGNSQGGGLSLVMGGLNGKFTSVISTIPGLCDHAAYRAGRNTAWPQLIPRNLRDDPAKEKIYRAFSAYFDAVNFARKITVPVLMSVGLIDHTCKPETIYAAYNEITAPKRIFLGSNTAHSRAPAFNAFVEAWSDGQLGLGPVIPLNNNDKESQ